MNLVLPGLYPEPYGDPHLREVSEEEGKRITFFAYEELLAFKRVCEKRRITSASRGIDKCREENN